MMKTGKVNFETARVRMHEFETWMSNAKAAMETAISNCQTGHELQEVIAFSDSEATSLLVRGLVYAALLNQKLSDEKKTRAEMEAVIGGFGELLTRLIRRGFWEVVDTKALEEEYQFK